MLALDRGGADTNGARVVRFTIESRFVHQGLAVTAVVPAGATVRRPLLVFLHGKGEDQDSNLAALNLARLHPRRFCAVGGHSAALYKSFGASAPVAFDNAADFARNDVFKAARQTRFNRLPVWIDVGVDDPFHDADAAFVSLLRARGVSVTYDVWPGGHTASYWKAHMAAYLSFYASALAQCSS